MPVNLTPITDGETQAAGQAVFEERKLAEADALVEALTDRERLFIELAWEAGARSTRDSIVKALRNPHAATLDAKAVNQTVSGLRNLPTVFERTTWELTPHHDPRVVSIVRSATRQLAQR